MSDPKHRRLRLLSLISLASGPLKCRSQQPGGGCLGFPPILWSAESAHKGALATLPRSPYRHWRLQQRFARRSADQQRWPDLVDHDQQAKRSELSRFRRRGMGDVETRLERRAWRLIEGSGE